MTLNLLQIGMEWFTENPGGLNRVYARLLDELAKGGVQSYGIVAGSSAVERESGGLVRSFAAPDASMLARFRGVRAAAMPWLRSHDHDAVVVSHFALYALPLIDQLHKKPFVVHFQGPWGDESRTEGASAVTAMQRSLVERLVYRRADAAIVLSSAFADMLASRFGVQRKRIHIVPGGVEADRFSVNETSNECRTALGWPLARPIVLCVRRLVRRVGIDTLVESAVEIRRRVPDALIMIAGSGPLRAELEARIAALQLSDTVRLLGFVPDADLPRAYRAASLSVVPTMTLEGFGLITVESLAAGTPCLVTPVGGLAGIVAPLSPELVMKSTSADAIADAVSGALTGVRKMPSAQACAAYARANYDWPVVAAQVRDVYESVL